MKTIETNGTRIAYDFRGEGEPLLLIMGLGADSSRWEDHVQEYEKHFLCILMDNRGVGQSDKPAGPYTTDMMAADAAGLLQALRLQKVHVVGISMGGAIAQKLALRCPDRVRSLVLSCTWPKCDTYTATVFEHFKRVRASVSAAEFVQLSQLWGFASSYFEKHEPELLEVQREAVADPMPQPQHAFSAQCDACITHDSLAHLDRIQVPTLITVGDSDILTPVHFSKTIAERVPNSEMLLFPGCGHAHRTEDLKRFNQVTLDFLRNI